MKKQVTLFFTFLFLISCAFSIGCLSAYSQKKSPRGIKKASVCRAKKISNSAPKAICAGFGKKSSVNGQIKTETISGHYKPSNGYKFVNSYSRSK